MADLHPTEGLLLDLALAEVDEFQRDQLTTHLARCERCRTVYGQIADSVDHVLAAAPRVEPPPGLAGAVLAAIGLDGDAGSGRAEGASEPTQREADADELGARRAARRGRDRRGLVLVAVAAAVAFLLGAGGMAVVMRSQDGSTQEAQAAGPALVTGSGQRVGTVLDSHYEGEPVLIVTITDGKVGKVYECQLVLADGTRQSAGTWELHEPAGATWVVDHPDAQVTAVELVTPTGHTWATAQL